MRAAALVMVGLLGAGCGILEPRDCTTMVVPGISVTVRDAGTQVNVPGPLVVVARDGAYADTARIVNPSGGVPDSIDFNPYQLVIERVGTYDLTVRAPGYSDWSLSGVPVTKGRCHVNTVQIVALLE